MANFRRLGLERFFPKPMIFYDVGAGVWDDDCLVVDMIRVFGCDSVKITAFEALRANFALFVGFLTCLLLCGAAWKSQSRPSACWQCEP